MEMHLKCKCIAKYCWKTTGVEDMEYVYCHCTTDWLTLSSRLQLYSEWCEDMMKIEQQSLELKLVRHKVSADWSRAGGSVQCIHDHDHVHEDCSSILVLISRRLKWTISLAEAITIILYSIELARRREGINLKINLMYKEDLYTEIELRWSSSQRITQKIALWIYLYCSLSVWTLFPTTK